MAVAGEHALVPAEDIADGPRPGGRIDDDVHGAPFQGTPASIPGPRPKSLPHRRLVPVAQPTPLLLFGFGGSGLEFASLSCGECGVEVDHTRGPDNRHRGVDDPGGMVGELLQGDYGLELRDTLVSPCSSGAERWRRLWRNRTRRFGRARFSSARFAARRTPPGPGATLSPAPSCCPTFPSARTVGE